MSSPPCQHQQRIYTSTCSPHVCTCCLILVGGSNQALPGVISFCPGVPVAAALPALAMAPHAALLLSSRHIDSP